MSSTPTDEDVNKLATDLSQVKTDYKDIDLSKVEHDEETPTSVSKKLSDEEIKANCEVLRTKIKSDKLFVENYRVDDGFLQRFLYCSKQDLDKSHARYFNYYKCITSMPGLERVLNGETKWLIDLMVANIDSSPINFNGLDAHGRAVISFDTGKINLDGKDNLFAAIVTSIIYLDYILENIPEVQTHGTVYIEDHASMTMKHYKSMLTDIQLNKVMTDLFQGGMPLMMKSIVICNEPRVFSILWKVIKLFLSKKMLARISLIGSKHEKAAEVLGGAEYVPVSLTGGLANPSQEHALSEKMIKEHLMKAFPFHSEPDHEVVVQDF